jgi:hypothetical protein
MFTIKPVLFASYSEGNRSDEFLEQATEAAAGIRREPQAKRSLLVRQRQEIQKVPLRVRPQIFQQTKGILSDLRVTAVVEASVASNFPAPDIFTAVLLCQPQSSAYIRRNK